MRWWRKGQGEGQHGRGGGARAGARGGADEAGARQGRHVARAEAAFRVGAAAKGGVTVGHGRRTAKGSTPEARAGEEDEV
jgi:hypothetical protein